MARTPNQSLEPEALTTIRHLHNMASERFFQRRRLEWRFSFTIWASLATTAAIVQRDGGSRLPEILIVGIFAFLAVALHGIVEAAYFVKPAKRDWQEGVQRSRTLRESIEELTDDLPTDCCYRPFFAHWWQPLVSFGLGTALTLAVSFA